MNTRAISVQLRALIERKCKSAAIEPPEDKDELTEKPCGCDFEAVTELGKKPGKK